MEIALSILFVTALLALALPKAFTQWKLRRWYKALNLKKHAIVFNQLYANIDGFNLSKKARSQGDAFEFLYGEIEFIPFIALLSQLQLDDKTIFYDLGSGTGKAVIACAMVFSPKKCCGIEIFELLHKSAEKQLHKLAVLPDYAMKATAVQFIHGDFLHVDFSEATLIFINATAFIEPLWGQLLKKMETLSPGTTVITTSKRIKSTYFTLTSTTRITMSWGVVNAYTHRRENYT